MIDKAKELTEESTHHHPDWLMQLSPPNGTNQRMKQNLQHHTAQQLRQDEEEPENGQGEDPNH